MKYNYMNYTLSNNPRMNKVYLKAFKRLVRTYRRELDEFPATRAAAIALFKQAHYEGGLEFILEPKAGTSRAMVEPDFSGHAWAFALWAAHCFSKQECADMYSYLDPSLSEARNILKKRLDAEGWPKSKPSDKFHLSLAEAWETWDIALENDGIVIEFYRGKCGKDIDVVIPKRIAGRKVTRVTNYAFGCHNPERKCGTVTVPAGIPLDFFGRSDFEFGQLVIAE